MDKAKASAILYISAKNAMSLYSHLLEKILFVYITEPLMYNLCHGDSLAGTYCVKHCSTHKLAHMTMHDLYHTAITNDTCNICIISHGNSHLFTICWRNLWFRLEMQLPYIKRLGGWQYQWHGFRWWIFLILMTIIAVFFKSWTHLWCFLPSEFPMVIFLCAKH